jgi:hypothetical protein
MVKLAVLHLRTVTMDSGWQAVCTVDICAHLFMVLGAALRQEHQSVTGCYWLIISGYIHIVCLLHVTTLSKNLWFLSPVGRLHCKKRSPIFPSPAGMLLTKLSVAGNN